MNKIEFTVEYPLGTIVYYQTDRENVPGMVVGLLITLNGSIIYRISFNGDIHQCYEEELRLEKQY